MFVYYKEYYCRNNTWHTWFGLGSFKSLRSMSLCINDQSPTHTQKSLDLIFCHSFLCRLEPLVLGMCLCINYVFLPLKYLGAYVLCTTWHQIKAKNISPISANFFRDAFIWGGNIYEDKILWKKANSRFQRIPQKISWNWAYILSLIAKHVIDDFS